jgi:DNA-binding GntR family transcriptional regulator
MLQEIIVSSSRTGSGILHKDDDGLAESLVQPSLPRGDDAYERIRRDVLACTLMPGSIVTENQLMAE